MNSAENKKSLAASRIKKNTLSRRELEGQILAFLDEASSKPGATDRPGCPLSHGLACILCTMHNDESRATPIDFFADGLTLWLAGEPGLKIRNIRANAGSGRRHLPAHRPQRAEPQPADKRPGKPHTLCRT